MRSVVAIAVIAAIGGVATRAQSPTGATFEVASIKRNVSGALAGGGQAPLPDGTEVLTNVPIRYFIENVTSREIRDIVGLPGWALTERYDVIAKPRAGSTNEQRAAMWQALFADRMKMVAHVEDRERDVYALVVDRGDGRLGPQLRRSSLDCSPEGIKAAPPATSADDFQNRCGMSMNDRRIIAGGIAIDRFALWLGGAIGDIVVNRTGLTGDYALTLTFAPRRRAGAPADATPDDAPDIFTAVREQLGLKLQRQKLPVPVLVVEHIERPTIN